MHSVQQFIENSRRFLLAAVEQTRLYLIPTSQDDAYARQFHRYLYLTQFWAAGFTLLMIPIILAIGIAPIDFLVLLSTEFLLALSLWVNHRGQPLLSNHIMLAGMTAISCYFMITSDEGFHDITILIFPLLLIFAAISLNRRLLLLYSGLTVLSLTLVAYLEYTGWLQTVYNRTGDPALWGDLITALALSITIAILARAFVVTMRNYLYQMAKQEAALQESMQQVRLLNEQLEKRVHERTAELEAANQELEAFSYAMSHDLRAPLRAISSYSNILREEYTDRLDDQADHYLNRLRENTRRMDQQIDNLLEFLHLRRKPLVKRTVQVEPLVLQVIAEMQMLYPQRQIEFFTGSLPPCEADPELLKQVYLKLVDNAIKFSSVREVARIEIGSLQENGETVYTVRDNGIGFDMQYVEKIFGTFERLHRQDEYSGTGAGLAFVRRIIERHGGWIRVVSAINGGTTFTFHL